MCEPDPYLHFFVRLAPIIVLKELFGFPGSVLTQVFFCLNSGTLVNF